MKKSIRPGFCFTLVVVVTIASISALAHGQRGRRTGATGSGTETVVSASEKAMTGTYTGATGNSAATASATGRRGGARGASAPSSTSGGSVQMNVSSYSASSELDAIVQSQDSGGQAVVKSINANNHGSVMVGGQSFPINLATSARVGSSYKVYLVSAKPFSSQTGPQGRASQGAAFGFIELTVDSSGNGTGALYTSTQIVVQRDGSIQARGGSSTATSLTSVTRQ